MATAYLITEKADTMKATAQLAKGLAVTMNAGLLLGQYLALGEPTSPYLAPIAVATALVNLIALATSKAGNK